MDRNLALEFVRVTEAAAIASARFLGRGDGKAADGAAVDEMRDRFNQIDFRGQVVIGEGAKDEAPELYTGEKVGRGWKIKAKMPIMDLAVDPLECTDSVAFGRYNAMSVIACGAKGSLLAAPDTYMDKIVVGSEAANVINLEAPVKINLKKIAKAKGKDMREVVVMILDRERNRSIINDVRSAGARTRLLTDGDVAAGVAACLPDSEIDVVLGSGGSTEAVLKAVAVKILGGQMFCRFKPRHNEDAKKIQKMGASLKKIYSVNDLAKGTKLTFTATGVIEGPLLAGVKFTTNHIITHSVVMRGVSKTMRYITAFHDVKIKSKFQASNHK